MNTNPQRPSPSRCSQSLQEFRLGRTCHLQVVVDVILTALAAVLHKESQRS